MGSCLGADSSSPKKNREACSLAGAITTLGRGGSDLTATVLGAALGVDEVQVWKDVDGELANPLTQDDSFYLF